MSSWEAGSARTLIEEMKLLGEFKGRPGARKVINSELWHACAGPLISLPQPGDLVYYFPQGHSEQVTASTRRNINSQVPNYPSLPYQMMCQVHGVALHADKETDEIYAQMTLQPVNSETDVFPIPDTGLSKSKHPGDYFCKTLTASDTSTHGGFSVPRRAAEKLFPQLDYSMQPPNQELAVRDLHDNSWTFRHIYRGQPKRHLLTSGWSVFVGAKRLKAGDSVLFIRDEKSQLLVGIRRANRQRSALPSVLSADSMHLGVFAAAAHAAANRSPFTVYYNPRACASEFVVPVAKCHKAAYNRISIGARFGMMFETEDSGKRRYMGTVVAINDCDPLRWPNSKWRNLQVEWDEHSSVERPDRVSTWEIDTPESLFVVPSLASTLKRQFNPEINAGGEIGQGTAVIKRTASPPSENTNGLSADQQKGSSIESQCFSPEVQKLLCGNRNCEQESLEESRAVLAELDAVDWSAKDEPPLMGDLEVNQFQLGQLTSEYMDSSWWFFGGSGQHSAASSADKVNVIDPEIMQSLNHCQANPDTKLLQSIYNTCGFNVKQEGGFSLAYHSNSSSCQDVQSQITTASLADCSGGTSSSNLDFDDRYNLNVGAWKQVSPPLRTYTKVHKAGSVGRSIDATRFRNYEELKHAIACMFRLEGQFDDPSGSGWKLVYVDYENDVLLVGDDPWEEFVTCVKCIRILSPSEVQQMSQEGLQLMNMVSYTGEAS